MLQRGDGSIGMISMPPGNRLTVQIPTGAAYTSIGGIQNEGPVFKSIHAVDQRPHMSVAIKYHRTDHPFATGSEEAAESEAEN